MCLATLLTKQLALKGNQKSVVRYLSLIWFHFVVLFEKWPIVTTYTHCIYSSLLLWLAKFSTCSSIQLLHQCLTSWRSLVDVLTLAMKRAAAVADWHLMLRCWKAWRAAVRESHTHRSAQLAAQQLRKERQWARARMGLWVRTRMWQGLRATCTCTRGMSQQVRAWMWQWVVGKLEWGK